MKEKQEERRLKREQEEREQEERRKQEEEKRRQEEVRDYTKSEWYDMNHYGLILGWTKKPNGRGTTKERGGKEEETGRAYGWRFHDRRRRRTVIF